MCCAQTSSVCRSLFPVPTERVKETPLALKALYDADLAEGDTIVAWAGKADAGKILGVSLEAGAAVRTAAAPVVEWLQESEDESEEEE